MLQNTVAQMPSKEIVCEIPNRTAFFHLLKNNPGLIIIKMGAEWCGPCKQIKPLVESFFVASPATVVCADIDVDQCFDFYSFMKSKKMVNGVPVLMCFKRENHTFIPDDVVTGADVNELHTFFKRCEAHLADSLRQHPPILHKRR